MGCRTRLLTHQGSAGDVSLSIREEEELGKHTPDITGVEDSFPIAFDQEHHGPGAVVGIEKRDANRQAGSEFDHRWGVQRDGSQKLGQMLVVQLAGFEDPLGEVHAVGVLLNAQKEIPRGG